MCLPQVIEFVHNEDPRIHRKADQQHKRGISALIKIDFEKIEREKRSDERKRDHHENGQRLFQRLEQHRANKKDNDNDQRQQGVLIFLLIPPGPARLRRNKP
jgi:hypothetical protein